MSQTYSWRIAGGSGDGIDSTSKNFATALKRLGYHIFTHRHYPSRIRGGHTYVEVTIGNEKVTSRGDDYDCLVALGDSFARNPGEEAYYGNEEVKPLEENLDELTEGGVIIYDTSVVNTDEIPNFEQRVEENNWNVYGLDLSGIARDHGMKVMRNTAGVGATCALCDIPTEPIESLLNERMSGDVLENNLAVLKDSYEQTMERDDVNEHEITIPEDVEEHEESTLLMNASTAIAYGSIDSGCRFISGYPMTPWTDVFQTMVQELPHYGGISEQVEDEIAAACLAIGASHAGVKAMTGSSGGGFALMSEPLSMAEMTETPVVFVEAMRGGPSTGLPTKPEQGDLEHVLYTGQGDSLRIAFAPGSIEEAYNQTRLAFKLAYDYHLPAIIVIDQKLSGEIQTTKRKVFDEEPVPDLGTVLTEEEIEDIPHKDGRMARYLHEHEDSPKGVAPRSIPGQKGGRYLATGNEHNQYGHISEDTENRTKMHSRRVSKIDAISEEIEDEELQTYFGDEDADTVLLTFGSQQGTVREVVKRCNDGGELDGTVRAVSVSQLAPYPVEEVQNIVDNAETVVFVEMNATGQFKNLTHKYVELHGVNVETHRRFDGEPIRPNELITHLSNLQQ